MAYDIMDKYPLKPQACHECGAVAVFMEYGNHLGYAQNQFWCLECLTAKKFLDDQNLLVLRKQEG